MADQSALIRAFADYARTISLPYEVGDVLYRLTDQVVDIFDIHGAGVSLAGKDGDLQFVSATNETITRIEQHQVQGGSGPCHDAYCSGEPVTVADLTAEDRWPSFVERALELDLRAVASIPMPLAERRIGALNVYSRSPREWPADELYVLQVLADMASGYVLNARTLTETKQLAEQLQHALDSRIVIEQAKGIVAERHGIDTAAAFQIIRQNARTNQAKVHAVARAIVDGVLRI